MFNVIIIVCAQLPTVAPYGSDGMGRVASGSNDETVRVWNCGTGRCTRVLRGHGASITCLGWPTPSRLVSGAAGAFWFVFYFL